jgi:hypothetical protein
VDLALFLDEFEVPECRRGQPHRHEAIS